MILPFSLHKREMAEEAMFKFGRLWSGEPIPMSSYKNISPKRVDKRRKRSKLAKVSRKRNQK